MKQKRPDVAVVGGGIVGLSIARELAGRGLQVALLEAEEELGKKASWAAAGMLAPLSESPLPGPFVDACRSSRDLGLSWAPRLAEESGIDLDYDTSGALAIGDQEGQLAKLESAAARIGEPCTRIDGPEGRALVPDLAPHHQELLHLPGEHRIDNRAVCAALAGQLRRLGVELYTSFKAEDIESVRGGVNIYGGRIEKLTVGQAILAAGAWSGQIAGLPPLPVLPVHGQMIALNGVDWPFAGSLRGADFYAVRRAGGQLLVGATAEELGFAERMTPDGVRSLFEWLVEHFPALGALALSAWWSGLRPATPDRLPLVGRIERNVLVATAHFRNGILLAPWTAERVAELALSREPAAEADRQALALFAPAGR
jgi:glycine oxidase ThiO